MSSTDYLANRVSGIKISVLSVIIYLSIYYLFSASYLLLLC